TFSQTSSRRTRHGIWPLFLSTTSPSLKLDRHSSNRSHVQKKEKRRSYVRANESTSNSSSQQRFATGSSRGSNKTDRQCPTGSLDRKTRTWFWLDFEDEQYSGYSVDDFDLLVREYDFLSLVERPGLLRAKQGWLLEPGKKAETLPPLK